MKQKIKSDRNKGLQVFINCPFDTKYKDLFYALLFTILDLGFIPRCSLESEDGGEHRLDKIWRLVKECPFGIHDISRTELNSTKLPRFNMPYELGLFHGYKKSFPKLKKKILVLDKAPYRYQQFISDLSGCDIKSHDDCVEGVIKAVRDWLRAENPNTKKCFSGANHIMERFGEFLKDLPKLCKRSNIKKEELNYIDFKNYIEEWLKTKQKSNKG